MALCWAGSQNSSSCKKRSSGAARQAVGGRMHQIMLQQLQQTLGQDLVLRSKGVFQLNDLQPAAVAAIVGGDHRPHHPPDGAAVRLGVRYGLQAGKVAGSKKFSIMASACFRS